MKQRDELDIIERDGKMIPVSNGRFLISATECEQAGWSVARHVYPWCAFKGDFDNPSTKMHILTDAEHRLWNAIQEDNEVQTKIWKLNRTKQGWEGFRKAHKDLLRQQRETSARVKHLAQALITAPFGTVASLQTVDWRPHDAYIGLDLGWATDASRDGAKRPSDTSEAAGDLSGPPRKSD